MFDQKDPEPGPWSRWYRVTEQRWVRVRNINEAVVGFETTDPSNGRGPGENNEEDVELTGSIRFDGCANMSCDCIHLCGAGQAAEVSACIGAAYTLAAERLASSSANGLDFFGDVQPFTEWQGPDAEHPEAIEA